MTHASAQQPRVLARRVYKAVNTPLTICGVERRMFFMALMVGAAAFNLFYSLLGAVLIGLGLYSFGLWATKRDAQMLRIIITSSRYRARYDCAKHVPYHLEVRGC